MKKAANRDKQILIGKDSVYGPAVFPSPHELSSWFIIGRFEMPVISCGNSDCISSILFGRK